MKKRLAVIDLGTNTFHLLIVTAGDNGGFDVVFRNQQYVKLGEEGIETIGAIPYARGIETMKQYSQLLEEYQVDRTIAFGTAALRTATNGKEFVKEVKQKAGIDIQLISGIREANLIYQGVIQLIPDIEGNGLIMDIGGGSVEFILMNKEEVIWSESFPIGVSVLFNKYHHSEPISEKEEAHLRNFLQNQLIPLAKQLKHHEINILIGASGTFDVVAAILSDYRPEMKLALLDVQDFYPLYRRIIQMDKISRLASEEIPDKRADMIVVAMILIDYVIGITNPEKIMVSSYAMKEGILYEMINT